MITSPFFYFQVNYTTIVDNVNYYTASMHYIICDFSLFIPFFSKIKLITIEHIFDYCLKLYYNNLTTPSPNNYD